MILRAITLAGGVAGAAGLSQYPEFSQQYTQNLAGQVTALQVVVADFDASAARSGLSREQALSEMTGTSFLEDRRVDMARTFARYDAIGDHLSALQTATPMARLTMPHRLGDGDTFASTWAQFKPAMPLTSAGMVSAVVGFAGGWAAALAAISLLGWPFRRRRVVARKDPPLSAQQDGIRDQ